MKKYKDFEKEYIGSSDIASLILVGYSDENGLVLNELHFGSDGCYFAYIVDDADVKIPEHYHKVAKFESWLKIYDDERLAIRFDGKRITVYRAADFGCIIQIIQ